MRSDNTQSNAQQTVLTSPLRYWHPVLLERKLCDEPVGITLCNRKIVLFRTPANGIGALDDYCPHRRMLLSKGKIAGEEIVCGYHGCRFDARGNGWCPSSPGAKIRNGYYEVQTRSGLIWVKEVGSEAEIRRLDYQDEGFRLVEALNFKIKAPMEFIIDNMSELEHTGSVHEFFAFHTDDLQHVETRVEPDDDQVYIYYRGPQRTVPYYFRFGMGIQPGDEFVQDALYRFDPVGCEYTLYWRSPETQQHRGTKLKFIIFYNMSTDDTSEMFVLLYSTLTPFGRLGINQFVFPILVHRVRRELGLDIRLVEGLDHDAIRCEDFHPTRFDRPIYEVRKRIAQRYFRHAG